MDGVPPDPDPLDDGVALVFLSVGPPGRNRFLSVVCADLRVLKCLAVHGKVGELISFKRSKFDTELAQKITKIFKFCLGHQLPFNWQLDSFEMSSFFGNFRECYSPENPQVSHGSGRG